MTSSNSPQFSDELGIQYSAENDTSVNLLNQAIEAYLASNTEAMPLLTNLLSADPDMPMAHCFRAYLLKLAADPRFKSVIKQEIKFLKKAALNEREALHLGILEHWAANQNHLAIKVINQLLASYPQDVLALRIAHYLHFYAGDYEMLRESVATSMKQWQPEQPFYGYVAGMLCFGLEEAGQYQEAEVWGRKAIAINKKDIWGAHAVAHILQMQGRFLEGIEWNAALLPDWTDGNNFVNHMHWHKALFHIGAGEHDAALQIYDDKLVSPLVDDFYLDVCNSTSLLMRLEMAGMNLSSRWEQLSEYSQKRAKDDELVFSSLHYLLTLGRLNDTEHSEQVLQHYVDWSKQDNQQGQVCEQVGNVLAQAIVNFSNQNFDEAAKQIQAVTPALHLIGGSHAQRQLFTEMADFAAAQ